MKRPSRYDDRALATASLERVLKELFTMWRSTRMVVLTAVCAACYVAVLLPFKIAVLVPGLTEVRPAAAVPILLSFLFGPAAAWGSGFGNLIGDILGGMFGPGSLVGFVGNFLYGYVPYALWRALRGRERPAAGGASWGWSALVMVAACLTIAAVIGWGVDAMGLAPFAALGNIILVNNLVTSLVLAMPLLALTYGRVERAGLLWHEVMDEEDQGAPRLGRAGAVLAIVAPLIAMIVGNAIAFGLLDAAFGAAGFAGVKGTAALGLGMAPFIALILAGCALL